MRIAASKLVVLCATIAAACTLRAVMASAGAEMVVSQKNRLFNPLDVTVAKDGTIVIVNDDADLMHHAFVEADSFNFDSGDQKPGSRTPVTFTVRGDFKVLCGIHPKMKLAVHVR